MAAQIGFAVPGHWIHPARFSPATASLAPRRLSLGPGTISAVLTVTPWDRPVALVGIADRQRAAVWDKRAPGQPGISAAHRQQSRVARQDFRTYCPALPRLPRRVRTDWASLAGLDLLAPPQLSRNNWNPEQATISTTETHLTGPPPQQQTETGNMHWALFLTASLNAKAVNHRPTGLGVISIPRRADPDPSSGHVAVGCQVARLAAIY